MANYRNRKVAVVDCGLFVEFAIALIPSFGTVYYLNEWVSAFPKSNTLLVGVGIPGLVKVRSLWEIYDDVDLWIFPDVYHGPLQEFLVSQGKRVWGSRLAERLELDRDWSKQICRDLGIDIGPYQVVIGLDNLRTYLRENDDQFVKISFSRGDFETFHAPNYRNIQPRLDELEWLLGAKKFITNFIVEAAIHDAVETGYDGFTIDGEYSRQAFFGLEIKDLAYTIESVPYNLLPGPVRSVNDKLRPIFGETGYRGFFSSEIRVVGDSAYLIDPCCRLGSPPGELLEIMVSNWPDVLWEGAEGVVVEPKVVQRFGAELLIHSQFADKNWQEIEFPRAMRDFVKLRNMCMIEGRYYVAPQQVGLPEIGAVVATGDTIEDAIKLVSERAEALSGYDVETYPASLAESLAAYEEVKKL
jgi:hypothetical protein